MEAHARKREHVEKMEEYPRIQEQEAQLVSCMYQINNQTISSFFYSPTFISSSFPHVFLPSFFLSLNKYLLKPLSLL